MKRNENAVGTDDETSFLSSNLISRTVIKLLLEVSKQTKKYTVFIYVDTYVNKTWSKAATDLKEMTQVI